MIGAIMMIDWIRFFDDKFLFSLFFSAIFYCFPSISQFEPVSLGDPRIFIGSNQIF